MYLSEKNSRYEIGLILVGGIIGYVSTFYGGIVLLLVVGAVIALMIGMVSDSMTKALLLGAFFGVVVVTASSQIVQGHSSNWHDDVLTSVFIPYFKNACIAAVLGGAVAAFGRLLRLKRR